MSTLPAYQNRLLASLSDTDRAWLRPHLDPVDLPLHTVLVEPGRPITHATFLEAGVTGAKYALSLLGKAREDVRLPLVPSTEPTKERIRAAMRHAGVL